VLEDFIVFPASQIIDETIFPQSAQNYLPGTTVVEPYKRQDPNRYVHHLKAGITTPPPISVLEFRKESESLQSADDPFTVATVVDKLYNKHACKHLSLNIPLHWQTSTEHGSDALTLSLEEYHLVYFTSELTYRPTPTELPFYIARIPPSNISGNSDLLPKVNAEILSPSILPPTNTTAGFSSSTSVANPNQLLLQWGNHLIPSFSLLQLAMTEGLSIHDLTVILGQCIIFGDTGPVLPINQFGSYAGSNRSKPAPLHPADYPWNPEAQLSPNIFLSSGPEKTATDVQAIELLQASPRTDFLTSYQRLDRWAEIIVLTDIAILFAWFLGFRPLKRHICFLLVLVTLWPVLVTLSSMRNMWTPASAVFATAITGWFSSFFLAPLVRSTNTSSQAGDEAKNLT